LIPRPLGRLRWFPIDTPLLAAGNFILAAFLFVSPLKQTKTPTVQFLRGFPVVSMCWILA